MGRGEPGSRGDRILKGILKKSALRLPKFLSALACSLLGRVLLEPAP